VTPCERLFGDAIVMGREKAADVGQWLFFLALSVPPSVGEQISRTSLAIGWFDSRSWLP
jgi:hypothetical protein